MCTLDLDCCRHGHTAGATCAVCDVEWTKVDVRSSLFRCSQCRGLFLEIDRDEHVVTHAA